MQQDAVSVFFGPTKWEGNLLSIDKHNQWLVNIVLTIITLANTKIQVINICIYWPNWAIGLMSRVFANGLGDRVQSQVESYQRLKKWYLMPPCVTPSIIRYRSRVKWSNPGKGVVPSPTLRCDSYWKESLRVTLN